MGLNEASLRDTEMDRLRRRDLHAFDALISRYQHRLYRYLTRLVSDPAIAEDLFQQTWLRVIEKVRSYDPSRNFDSWLFAIAHNLVIDYYRQRKPRSLDESDTGDAGQFLAVEPDALELFLQRERSTMLAGTVQGLPVIYREVLALRFDEDMKLEDIAHVLSIPVSTVKSRLHRALENLRHRLEGKFLRVGQS